MNSPFNDPDQLEKDIQDFINRFRATVRIHGKRMSDYFEMTCFNKIVRFYELKGYTVEVRNLKRKEYRYKCSPAGIFSNFSFFEASISNTEGTFKYEIHHNLAVQSSHNKDIFTTPDITVIKSRKAKTTKKYYDSGVRFSYVKNLDCLTFCEAKQLPPFPELLFNFIGIVNELKKEYMTNDGFPHNPVHIAPSLMISGIPNKQTSRIKMYLEERYCINILFDLYHTGSNIFSKNQVSKLRIAGKTPSANPNNKGKLLSK